MFPRQKGICLIAKLVLPVAVFMMAAQATTYYVATTGSDSFSGSLNSPFRTITYAYSKVTAGDSILVQPGSYTDYSLGWGIYLNKNGTAGHPITLKSIVRGGAIIDGSGQLNRPAGIYLYGTSYNIVDGFIIRNCANYGIGVFNDGAIAVAYNRFVRNEIYNATGSGVYESEPSNNNYFGQNYVHDNGSNAGYDHGFYVEGSNDTIVNNIITHNLFGAGIQLAAYANISNYTICQNTIANNATNGIVVWSDSAVFSFSNIIIANNIVYGNKRGIAGCSPVGAITLNNNISYNNSSTNYTTDYCGGGTAVWTNYNLIQADPKFVNAASDFHLQSGSPAIGAGIILPSVTQDFHENPRSPEAGYDIGAYEYAVTGALPGINLPVKTTTGSTLTVFDISGRIRYCSGREGSAALRGISLKDGVYFVQCRSGYSAQTQKYIVK
ncbi:MAG: right-handed parallel beta-helix repeat-containing protein [Chitinivibrionales bacterium]|nr:right-handed parallel beta-helix repeat-containing protein [Chitinivibrionales bacterium]